MRRSQWPETAPDRFASWLADRWRGLFKLMLGDYYDPALVGPATVFWLTFHAGVAFQSWAVVLIALVLLALLARTAWKSEQRWRAEP